MAIETNNVLDFFEGGGFTALGGNYGAVAIGGFSAEADIAAYGNSENVPSAVFVLECKFATMPAAHSVLHLHAQKLDLIGSDDSPVPSANNLSQKIATFVVDGDGTAGVAMFLPDGWRTLPNFTDTQNYKFYLENQSGQAVSAGWKLHIRGATKGAKAQG